jgi:hypothetical protein
MKIVIAFRCWFALKRHIMKMTQFYLIMSIITLSYLTSHIVRMAGFIDMIHSDYIQVSAILLGLLTCLEKPPEF